MRSSASEALPLAGRSGINCAREGEEGPAFRDPRSILSAPFAQSSKGVVLGPAAALPRNLLVMQTLGPHPRAAE